MGEYAAHEGELDATGMRFAIAVARFNRDITEQLLDGARAHARASTAPTTSTSCWVPGAYELPLVAQAARGDRRRSTRSICLGAVDPGRDRALRVRRGRVRGRHHARRARHGYPGDLRRADRRQPRAGARPVGGKDGHKGEEAARDRDRDGVAAARAAVSAAVPYDAHRPFVHARHARRPIRASRPQIHAALGDARTVVNVGAGTGSYEPRPRVVAVDRRRRCSHQRARRRGARRARRRRSAAVRRRAFDAALGVAHDAPLERSRTRAARAAAGRAPPGVFFFEPSFGDDALDRRPTTSRRSLDLESERNAPGTDDLARALDVAARRAGAGAGRLRRRFGGCYWNRPEAYLDPVVQAGMSCFAQMDRRRARARHGTAAGASSRRARWDAKYGAPASAGRDAISAIGCVVAGLP